MKGTFPGSWLLAAFILPPLLLEGTQYLSMRVLDEQGNLTPARAWVNAGEERLFEPLSPESATPYARDKSFSFDGVFTIMVPVGEVTVHVEKGKEYMPLEVSLPVEEGKDSDLSVQLNRWVDMPAEGWYSADLHVHLGQDDPRVLQQLALADDVHLVPAFTYWLRGRGETWNAAWPDDSYTRPVVIDDRHLITRNNIEIERINRDSIPGGFIGATFLYNLNRPVTADRYGEHFPTDASLCRIAQAHSPGVVLDSDKPSWAETVIGVALGAMDTIQLCHNHYHRYETLSGGWGMIGPLAIGESNAAEGDGLFHRTNELYYRFLNCGFRLGVSGGSAIGVMPVASGQHRVYASVEGEFTADKFWSAVKAGRSFATSGPMLHFEADGQGMGSTIRKSSGDSSGIVAKTRVRSIDKLESLQIIHNGQVVVSKKLVDEPVDPVLSAELTHELLPQKSGWLAARALYRAPDGLLRQAHTSPIYISVDDLPVASKVDADYMLRWIAILEEIARNNPDRFPSAVEQDKVLADYAEARSVYQRIGLRAGE